MIDPEECAHKMASSGLTLLDYQIDPNHYLIPIIIKRDRYKATPILINTAMSQINQARKIPASSGTGSISAT